MDHYRFSVDSRLATFEDGDWPVSFLSGRQMADAGFYSLHVDDTVCCPYCKVWVGNWEEGDDPLADHWKWSPRCPYLCGAEGDGWPLRATPVCGGGSREPESRPKPNCVDRGVDVCDQLTDNRRGSPTSPHLNDENASEPTEPVCCVGSREPESRPQPKVVDQLLCKICYDDTVSVLLDGCCHLVMCDECADNVTICPVCRAKITNRIHVYLC